METKLTKGTIDINRPKDKTKAAMYNTLVAIYQAYSDDERVDTAAEEVASFNNPHKKGKRFATEVDVVFLNDKLVKKLTPRNWRKRDLYYALVDFVDQLIAVEISYNGIDTTVHQVLEHLYEKAGIANNKKLYIDRQETEPDTDAPDVDYSDDSTDEQVQDEGDEVNSNEPLPEDAQF
jgi:hypothetical protein